MKADRLRSGTVEQDVPDLFGELVKGGVDVKMVMPGQGVQHLVVVQGAPAGPGQDGPLAKGEFRVGHDQLVVEIHPRSEPAAVGAGPVGAVEGKHAGRQLRHADAAAGAGVPFAEKDLLKARCVDADEPAGQPGCRFQGIPKALADPFTDDQPVHDDVDVVASVLFKGDFLAQFPHPAVDADPDEAVLQQFFEFLLKFSLFPADEGGQQVDPRAVWIGKDLIHHHIDRLGPDFLPALMAVGDADPGEEKAEIIVDLGDRAHRRAGILAGGPLFDGNGRREAFDRFHVGLVHLADELTGVGRKRLHVPALPLGVNGVESQGGLAGTAEAGDDDKPVPGDVDVDVLQVVLGGALDSNAIHIEPSREGSSTPLMRDGPAERGSGGGPSG